MLHKCNLPVQGSKFSGKKKKVQTLNNAKTQGHVKLAWIAWQWKCENSRQALMKFHTLHLSYSKIKGKRNALTKGLILKLFLNYIHGVLKLFFLIQETFTEYLVCAQHTVSAHHSYHHLIRQI